MTESDEDEPDDNANNTVNMQLGGMNDDESLDPGQQLMALQAADDPNKYYQEQIKTHRKNLKKKNQDGENLANTKNSEQISIHPSKSFAMPQ